jgi:hypothetical protein
LVDQNENQTKLRTSKVKNKANSIEFLEKNDENKNRKNNLSLCKVEINAIKKKY